MSEDFEFEDDEPVNARAGAPEPEPAASFDAFADEEVDASAAPAESVPPSDFSTKATVMPGSMSSKDFDAFAGENVGGEADPDAESPDDADIKPGQGKDLWTCPHCGSKNKPNRDNCRKCGKTVDEDVIVPLFSRPPVQLGALAGVIVLLFLIYSMATAVDVSLKQAGVDFIEENYHNNGSTVAGSGRVFRASSSDKQMEITIVFGRELTEKKPFGKLRYSTKSKEMTRGKTRTEKFIILRISNDDNSQQTLSKGDYAAFSATYGAVSDAGEPENHIFTVNASEVMWNK